MAVWEVCDRGGRDILEQVLFGEQKKPGFVTYQIRGAKATAHNRKQLVWLGAKEGAGFLFGPLGTGLGVMEQVMKDSSAPERMLAATLLAQEKGPETIADLGQALVDKTPLVRTPPATFLGGPNTPTTPR